MNSKAITLTSTVTVIKPFLLELQQRFCDILETEDGQATFAKDEWQFQEGGGGITRVLSEGQVIEKAGVNFSHVRGASLPQAATQKRPELANLPFQALGVSVVVHPRNPYVPTAHFNVRFIVVGDEQSNLTWWFGGGFDLTPYYPFEEDCIHWHRIAKQACEPFGNSVYSEYKQWADRYFYLKHRQEARGVGGLFFDDLNVWEFDRCFDFMKSVSEHFMLAYQPIIAKRQSEVYGERERAFQLYRRGRYVEFNLLYDRGTLFGLQSGGRTESILMSLPPLVAWQYQWQAEAGSQEAGLVDYYLKPREWV